MEPAIGMMEGAFFVSKNEIFNWINELLLVKVNRIEQFASGNLYCQILDVLYPGKINLSKVNWKAKLEWEFVNNFKLLQQSFLKCNIKKYIEVKNLNQNIINEEKNFYICTIQFFIFIADFLSHFFFKLFLTFLPIIALFDEKIF